MLTNVFLSKVAMPQGFAIDNTMDYGPSVLAGNGFNGLADFNGDGYSDILIGSYGKYFNETIVSVVFGHKDYLNMTTLNLATLTPREGSKIHLGYINDVLQISWAGDFNGDGYHDIIIGEPDVNNLAGISYLVLGNRIPAADIYLPSGAIAISGVNIPNDFCVEQSGSYVSGAGDFNNDGFDDVIIMNPTNCGGYNSIAYVVYGSASPKNIILASGNQGFSNITGLRWGNAVSGAGDVNGDGFDDILIGDISYKLEDDDYVDSQQLPAGRIYTILGSSSHSGLDLLEDPAGRWTAITGASHNGIGYYFNGAGDVNGDGYHDIIINGDQGVEYVIYGSSSGIPNINLAANNIHYGFSIITSYSYTGNQYTGYASFGSVYGIGDINKDGYDDVMLCAVHQSLVYGETSGFNITLFEPRSYVVYGGASVSNVYLGNMTLDQGFYISQDRDGFSFTRNPYFLGMSGIGDFNGDGYDDIIVNAFDGTSNLNFVFFGNNTNNLLSSGAVSNSPSIKPTSIPSITSTSLNTVSTTVSSDLPIKLPTFTPTHSPSLVPTDYKTKIPTSNPSYVPVYAATYMPTVIPSKASTVMVKIAINKGGSYNGTSLNENFIINSSKDVTIAGKGGYDQYTLEPNAETVLTINDFNCSLDVINLKAFDIYGFSDVNITSNPTKINLAKSQKIELLHVGVNAISSDNFIYADQQNNESSTPHSAFPYGAAIGGVLGGAATVIGIGYCIFAKINHYYPFKPHSVIPYDFDFESNIHVS